MLQWKWAARLLLALCLVPPPTTVQAGEAFGSPGATPVRAPGSKSFLGTAVGNPSRVWFTGFRGIVSEVFYPQLDTPNTIDLQFLVGDQQNRFVDEEKLQNYTVKQADPRSMRWQIETENQQHGWQISKQVFTDSQQDALIQRVTFRASQGKTLGDFKLYLLFKPALDNTASHNTAQTLPTAGSLALVASHQLRSSALLSSLPWHVQNGVPMLSNGFVGQSDGWTDLLGKSGHTMDWTFDQASDGNVAQMGWLDLGDPSASSISFDIILGFGNSLQQALYTANSVQQGNRDQQASQYDDGWHRYTASLSDQGGHADDSYYLAAMTLKTAQDKSNGAMVAGMGTPWGASQNEGNNGGYHLVWPRDLFKFANALITAGDQGTARQVVSYLFTTLQQKNNCGQAEYQADGCPNGYSRIGRFPQNAWINGQQYWQGSQMDEQAMPILLAWRLGPAISGPLWPNIKLTADYIVNTGPWTYQERWEENAGYSPSTIAAEIAGLVSAADIARQQGDQASAGRYLAAADYWQQNLTAWTWTTTGPLSQGGYYLRINPANRSGSGSSLASFAPSAGPNSGQRLDLKNGGGSHDARAVIDGGFLELIRLGIKRADDPAILSTLVVYDQVLGQSLPLAGTTALQKNAWFRYNFDGYGEHNDNRDFEGTGRGRLWPIFTAERGMYEIARQGTGAAGLPYQAALQQLRTAEGFLPEQVWSLDTTLPDGWQVSTPSGEQPGKATRSILPLNWAMGEYISLLASIQAGRIIDIPEAVCSRYFTCQPPAKSGEVSLQIRVRASTVPGQQLYITGNQAALGNWNTDLGLPLDASTYPLWQQQANLPASQAIEYKYYRKNADGSVTWEALNGNRQKNLPARGSSQVEDQLRW